MPDPRERPIIFSAPMVRAILDGRKTQTRRVVKPQSAILTDSLARSLEVRPPGRADQPVIQCPYGQVGDWLWVREPHSIHPTHGQHRDDGKRWGPWAGMPTMVSEDGKQIAYYREGFDRCDPGRWRPSIHMPRWASRITLEITGVRVERLQDIGEADARDEGAIFHDGLGVGHSGWRHDHGDVHANARGSFARLWNQINGKDSWAANPWVWVVEFRRLEGRDDG